MMRESSLLPYNCLPMKVGRDFRWLGWAKLPDCLSDRFAIASPIVVRLRRQSGKTVPGLPCRRHCHDVS
jgi:hypothetical protein